MKVNWDFIELMKRGREGYINNRKLQQFFKEKISMVETNKILDVGCGIGTVPRFLTKVYGKSLQIFGIDLDQNLIEWGQRHWCKSENIHLSQGNVYELDFPAKDFDIITSFGLIEWLDNPLIALNEMMRVKKSGGKIITLVLEKGKYERFPVNKKDQEFYREYLEGIKKLGYPIENEGQYIQDLLSKYDLVTTRYEFLIEYKTPISEKLLELWEKSFNKEDFLRFASDSSEFYFQFLKEVGWTKERLLKFIEDELSLQSVLEFYKAHLGEELIQCETIIILESKK